MRATKKDAWQVLLLGLYVISLALGMTSINLVESWMRKSQHVRLDEKGTCSDSVTRWLFMLDTAGKLRLPMLPKQIAKRAIGLLKTKMRRVCWTTLANKPAHGGLI